MQTGQYTTWFWKIWHQKQCVLIHLYLTSAPSQPLRRSFGVWTLHEQGFWASNHLVYSLLFTFWRFWFILRFRFNLVYSLKILKIYSKKKWPVAAVQFRQKRIFGLYFDLVFNLVLKFLQFSIWSLYFWICCHFSPCQLAYEKRTTNSKFKIIWICNNCFVMRFGTLPR